MRQTFGLLLTRARQAPELFQPEPLGDEEVSRPPVLRSKKTDVYALGMVSVVDGFAMSKNFILSLPDNAGRFILRNKTCNLSNKTV